MANEWKACQVAMKMARLKKSRYGMERILLFIRYFREPSANAQGIGGSMKKIFFSAMMKDMLLNGAITHSVGKHGRLEARKVFL